MRLLAGTVLLAALVVAAPTPARSTQAICRASVVHYRSVPSPRGVEGVPWVASTNGAFRGYLFYWGGTRWARTRVRALRIFTTKARVRVNPKVLWVALGRPGASVTLSGRRLDAPGAFAAHYPAATGGGQFPSYVSVPAAGCWRVRVQSGALHGTVTLAATDTP